jgi:hypothetical protein
LISPTIRVLGRNTNKPLYQTCEYSTATNTNTPYHPESLALNHINSGKPTTSNVINGLLLNQQVSITQEELDKLKAISGVKFDLPLNDETFRAFIALVGRQRSQKSGVYVFTYKATGSKYVGSSNNLSCIINS